MERGVAMKQVSIPSRHRAGRPTAAAIKNPPPGTIIRMLRAPRGAPGCRWQVRGAGNVLELQ